MSLAPGGEPNFVGRVVLLTVIMLIGDALLR
jgi:hypothetical protein